MYHSIDSERLKIIACNVDILALALKGDEALASHLQVLVEPGWTEFGTAPLQYSMRKLATDEEKNWWTWLPLHKKDNRLIGTGGYKGRPLDGTVEIGYEIAPAYRQQGLASEFATALVQNAFRFPAVQVVSAHTLAEENASCRVLQKSGFTRIEEVNDPDDGLLWKWEINRPVIPNESSL